MSAGIRETNCVCGYGVKIICNLSKVVGSFILQNRSEFNDIDTVNIL